MHRFNRQHWLIPLTTIVVILVTDARSILINILTADKPSSLRELFLSPWRLPLWFTLFGLACILVWLSLKSSRQSPEEQKQQQEYNSRKLLLKNVGAKIKESSRRQTLPKEIELRWELVRFDRRDEKIRGASRKSFPGNAVIEQFLDLEIGTTMLILGDRGAGKSTMLYKLAQALSEPADQELDRAFKEHNTLNTSVPIPVVLHLLDWERYCRGNQVRSSFATFQAWLVSALDRQYRIKPEFGAPWIEVENLVLLLDGLDELHNRNECIKAIKQFRQERRTTKIIICCQSQIYESLMQDELFNTQLGIEQAFCAQTLRSDQIEEFLSQPGEKVEKIRAAYQAMEQSFR